ncbi:Serine/threonine-protein kinase AFC3 [Acorus gramineus]|uniref:Serine/threonine-protein kinase AFC3 n=1 Tax=Acorus gramineus TaxID=55184 RepID=A0AAV9B8Q1_ACOGR|nr:Serine/threonine-protein kinase AFC3 [Acorus gramineus]
MLETLNKKFDPDDKHHIVRMLDHFLFQHHLCISFEMLGPNLYDLIKENQFKGLSLSFVQLFSKQILHGLVLMKEAGIIHCDLKPENILISTGVKLPEIKIIDFGSACNEGRTVYSYIQSRYYRSPEVLLGYPYNTAIDMWSFGCIIAELFLGLPLFPGASEYDVLTRMIETLGGQPPTDILVGAKHTNKFFKRVEDIHIMDNGAFTGLITYKLLTEQEFEARELKKPVIGKRYFNYVKYDEIIANYPYRKNLDEEHISKEKLTRLALIDLLRGLFEFDPKKRWSPLQASRHPFVTGEPFTCPYQPAPETPGIDVVHNVVVNLKRGGGHWLKAGLSLQSCNNQVMNMNTVLPHNNPYFQMASVSHAGSYGSLGSHGSYNDSGALGTSYGSYGDNNSMHPYYTPAGPSGLSIRAPGGGSILGASPDARHRSGQLSHGKGFSGSPSTGNFGPMSLGVSPSQFTPPSSQISVSSGSPGKYGPTSPARSNVHGSPFSKVAAANQYGRRRSWGAPSGTYMQSHGSASSQHCQGHHAEGPKCGYPESSSRGHVGSPRSLHSISNVPSWRQQRGQNGFSSGLSSTVPQNLPPSHEIGSDFAASSSIELLNDEPTSSSLELYPGDWDPTYSDEQLLDNDNHAVNSLAAGVTNLQLAHTMESTDLKRFDRFGCGSNQSHASTSYSSTNQRTQEPFNAYSHPEEIRQAHDMHGGFVHPSFIPYYTPHLPQNSPSRFGQQYFQRFDQTQPSVIHGGHNHFQQTRPICSNLSPLSPTRSTFAGVSSWGQRTGLPMTTFVSASRARQE